MKTKEKVATPQKDVIMEKEMTALLAFEELLCTPENTASYGRIVKGEPVRSKVILNQWTTSRIDLIKKELERLGKLDRKEYLIIVRGGEEAVSEQELIDTYNRFQTISKNYEECAKLLERAKEKGFVYEENI